MFGQMERIKFWVGTMVVAGVTLGFLQGCAHESDRDFTESMAQIRRVEPPTFLTAEVANAFNNATFSAHVEAQRQPTDARPFMTGDLFGRGGNLFFVADEPGKKQKIAGRVSALWDASSRTAYLLNDPLQGYAPILNAPGAEVAVSRDAANFPTRIQGTNGMAAFTLTISKVRPQAPPPELFVLPNGFKAYPSTDALLTELMHRRTEALDARSRLNRDHHLDMKPEDENAPIKPPARGY